MLNTLRAMGRSTDRLPSLLLVPSEGGRLWGRGLPSGEATARQPSRLAESSRERVHRAAILQPCWDNSRDRQRIGLGLWRWGVGASGTHRHTKQPDWDSCSH